MFVMMCIKWNWKQQQIFWKKIFHVTNLEFSISEMLHNTSKYEKNKYVLENKEKIEFPILSPPRNKH